MHIAALITALA